MSIPSRRSAYNLLYAVAAVAVLGACGGASRGELRATLTPAPDATVRAALRAPAATRMIARANGVDVVGQLVVPTPCHRIATAVERQDRVVTLTVHSEADRGRGSTCIQEMTPRTYTAQIRGLVPGEYLVRVVHDSTLMAMQDGVAEQVARR